MHTADCFGLDEAIRAHYPRSASCRAVRIGPGGTTRSLSRDQWTCGLADVDGFRICLEDSARIDALYFLAGDQRPADPSSRATLKAAQESNEIQLLRLVKCLKQTGKIAAKVDTYLLTLDNHCIDAQPSRYWGAGAAGLGYSLAQGNHQFRVRNLDLSSQDFDGSRDTAALVAAITREPASDRGEVFKLQQNRRYRPTFFRLNWDPTAPCAIKQGGTYLIVGGSGIVGQIITRHLIEKYQANVVWIGRSAPQAANIEQALHAF